MPPLADQPVGQTADYAAPESRGKAATAIRSGAFLHVDEQLQTAAAEASAEIKKEEDAESRELRLIAHLAEHPGWQIVRRVFEERISQYRSGKIIGEALADPKIMDRDIGSMVRNTNLVAAELTMLINKVELAALEDRRQREELRNATIRERVAKGA